MAHTPASPACRPGPLTTGWRSVVLAALVLTASPHAPAQSSSMAAADPGLLETGAPHFAVLSRESIGLSASPTDLHMLSDGRVLVVAGQDLALGDGVRWEVYHQADTSEAAHGLTVAVDSSDTIYQSVSGGFARVEFGPDGRWRLEPAATWPADASPGRPVPRHVVQAGGEWYWHANSGEILAWKPGTSARAVGSATTVETILHFRGLPYLSDRSAPSISILGPGDDGGLLGVLNRSAAMLATSLVELPDGRALVGTAGSGVQVVEGNTLRPLTTRGMIAPGRHIRDLCPAGGGLFAAAVANHGVAFFDLQGRIVQSLDRTLDHRLARVTRLVPGSDGTLWGVLTDSVFRVTFPSRISDHGPLIVAALMENQPMRLDGRLWLLSDRQALRAVYDDQGRLTGMVPDTPAGAELFMLSSEPGVALATSERGAYFRANDGWRAFAPDVPYLYVIQTRPIDGQWLYAAKDEIGWLRRTGDGLALERTPMPGLGMVYHSAIDARGDIWLERGLGALARLRPSHPGADAPVVELFGAAEGVPRGWAQAFAIDGTVRFNIADTILRFDETAGRFVPDEVFARHFAGLGPIVGRPGRDARGRLWIPHEHGIALYEGSLDDPRRVPERVHPGFSPWFLTFQEDGVVWMQKPGRIARYDPAMPAAPEGALRAIITRLTLAGSRHIMHRPGESLPALGHDENSISVHFMAAGDPFTASVQFEVMLEGASSAWTRTGSGGVAVFDQLKEGRYTFRVRPRSGTTTGAEAALAFRVLPPWYRTSLAYVSYAISGLALLLLAAWVPAYLGRREQARLEHLVEQRTRELLASQDQLHRAVESGSIGLWEFDTATEAFVWNEQCNTICGLPASNPGMALREFQRLLDPVERDVLEQVFGRALETGAGTRLEHRVRRADGSERWVLVIGRSAPRAAGAPAKMRGAMLDITERKLAEESIRSLNATLERRVAERTAALEAANRELEAANRELEAFSYSVSHDLRAPLRGIDGWSLALLEDCGGLLDKTGLDYLARVRTECGRLNQLIEDLLKLSRTTRAEFHPAAVDLSTLASDTARRVAETRPGMQVRFTCQPALRAQGDPALLEAAFFNLLDNAWKFSAKNPAPQVEFGRTVTPRGPAFFVRDNGAGFDMRHARKLFGVFQRMHTQEEFPGTGVGLATVQRIIHRHGGDIWAESTQGRGAAFFFTLGAAGASSPPGAAHASSTRPPPPAPP